MVGNRKKSMRFLDSMIENFNPQLQQVLFRLLEIEPSNCLTLEKFLTDPWFRFGSLLRTVNQIFQLQDLKHFLVEEELTQMILSIYFRIHSFVSR
jgi:hypothetical protein